MTEAETEVIVQRAMREARINASLQHPYAVAVFDVVEHEGQPCIVMELVPSVPLTEVMRELGNLAPRRRPGSGRRSPSALAAAHALGIVHRDVKPGNVLIGDDGAARICDFGISRSFGDATLTMTGMITGTPAYLAPETARGEESTSASDVHSLGATLYAAVEGEPPFGSEGNAIAVLYRVTAGEMRPPRAGRCTGAAAAVDDEPAPGDRPTMAEASARLSALAGGSAPLPTALPPTGPHRQRSEPEATEAIPAPTRALPLEPSSAASPATRALGPAADATPRLPTAGSPVTPAAAQPAEGAPAGFAGTTEPSAASTSTASSSASPTSAGPGYASPARSTSPGPSTSAGSSGAPSPASQLSAGPSHTSAPDAGSGYARPSSAIPAPARPSQPGRRSRRGLVVAIVVSLCWWPSSLSRCSGRQ